MKQEVAEKLRKKRSRKAGFIREMRGVFGHLRHGIVQRMAEEEYGRPERPRPETMRDYWPIPATETKEDCAFQYSFQSDEHGESWTHRWLLQGDWDDMEICDLFGIYERDGGSGRAFLRFPCVERNGHSTLITQTGGLDI